MMSLASLRRLSVLAAASAVALAAGGCRNSPCSPPCEMAEQPAPPSCAPPPPVCQAPLQQTPIQRSAPQRVVPPAVPPPVPAPVDDSMRASLAAKAKQIEELEAQNRRSEEESASRQRALDSVAHAKVAAEESAQRLAEELKGMPGAQVLVEGPNVVVIVTDSFDSGSDKLKPTPDLRAALRATSMAIARHPEAVVAVVGHTDSKPITRSTWSDNTALSRARAEAVAKALAVDGVERDRIKVDGVGANDPLVAPEKTATDRAKNRRVEIELAFKG